MKEIILSLYELLGPLNQSGIDERDVKKHVDGIFEVGDSGSSLRTAPPRCLVDRAEPERADHHRSIRRLFQTGEQSCRFTIDCRKDASSSCFSDPN